MCIEYLDDILLITSTYEGGLDQVQVVIKTLLSLGFVINEEKRTLCPVQECKVLVFLFITLNMTVLN